MKKGVMYLIAWVSCNLSMVITENIRGTLILKRMELLKDLR
jgi:hypothetical protein